MQKCLPVMTSLSHVTATTAEPLIPAAGKAEACGKCHSSEPEPAGPLNIRMKAPPVDPATAFPCWKRNGFPWLSVILGCNLCCATCTAGAFSSTMTIESENAWMAAAGRLHFSGAGTVYGLTSLGFRKIVWWNKPKKFDYHMSGIEPTRRKREQFSNWLN